MERLRNDARQSEPEETPLLLSHTTLSAISAKPKPPAAVSAPLRYNLVRRLIVPDEETQLALQRSIGVVMLDFPTLRAAQLRKPGTIMVPIMGRKQLQACNFGANPSAELKAALSEVCTKMGARADNPIHAIARHLMAGTGKDQISRFYLEGRSTPLKIDRALAAPILRRLTGADSPYDSHENFNATLAEFPGSCPPRADARMQSDATSILPIGTPLKFGPIEPFDQLEDQHNYLIPQELMG